MEADTNTDPVLTEIEEFLLVSQMTATAFGHSALNDPALVHELRKGRECKRATRARIRGFISAQTAASSAVEPMGAVG